MTKINFRKIKDKILNSLFEYEDEEEIVEKTRVETILEKPVVKPVSNIQVEKKEEKVLTPVEQTKVQPVEIKEKKTETIITAVKVEPKTKPIIVEEKYEKRDIISPMFGNLTRPTPKAKTTAKSSVKRTTKILSPMYGAQSDKPEIEKEIVKKNKKLELAQQN